MKYFELTESEKNILADFESGELRPVRNAAKQKRLYKKIAANTLAKNKNINIRLPARVLHQLKVKAAREGIPYQTLAASILHKYSMGKD